MHNPGLDLHFLILICRKIAHILNPKEGTFMIWKLDNTH